ncbi:hypothetical protein [Phaeodactylibacter sp.]|uniref:hypothetical protein n=1 Tax=Phaeodactylibacter sp. TaxID=1940289 RepID=UPI0025FDF588|nr:hypothetical protein [Phaeodactylibacter sp.]MCI4650813.1 hypothetical protein [Phaeodactylibacter sp.]MCI5089770.1 hypothetical protein [Phaeodactylibacter sp.]
MERPIVSDIVLGIILALLIHFYGEERFTMFKYNKESLIEICNQLISASLSSGGFVLAALAILASIKQGVKEYDEGEITNSGKEFFFNSKGYGQVLRIYFISCLVFVGLFLYFSLLSGSSSSMSERRLLYLVIIGTTMLVSAFVRCIYILWEVVKIR